MLTQIASVVALFAAHGSAAAISSCPLSVSIADTADHVAHVAVKNTGNEAITVFKTNTVFADQPNRDLLLSDEAGNELKFDGVYINPVRSGLSPSLFVTLQPGETITKPVNAARSYKLSGVPKASVRAVQSFHYVHGSKAPSALADTLVCNLQSSNEASIVPDQSRVAAEHVSATANTQRRSLTPMQKRDVTYSSCSTSQTSSLKTSVADAITLASNAATAANSGADYWTTWFKSTSVKSKTITIYNDVVNVRSKSPRISCTDIYSYCTDGSALLYTVPSENTIVPCPSNGYWQFSEYAADCAGSDYDRAGSILHEMTHLYGTDDYAYGRDACLQLSATQAAANADTYELYSESVRLGGCKKKA